MKHTPGPWKVSEKYSEHNGVINSDGFDIAEVQHIQINENTPENKHWSESEKYHHEISDEEQSANALLIAAAPEMLEVLILELKNYFVLPVESRVYTLSKLRGVVEKATGLKIEEVLK